MARTLRGTFFCGFPYQLSHLKTYQKELSYIYNVYTKKSPSVCHCWFISETIIKKVVIFLAFQMTFFIHMYMH
jgi:hypothetical protein